MTELYFNPRLSRTVVEAEPTRAPLGFHKKLPGYAPTPLVPAAKLAKKLGLAQVWVKDESHRLGLPAFKILGASWAIYKALVQRFGQKLKVWSTLQEWGEKLKPFRPITLTAATDGNHGRAVAHVARLLGLEARIFVPAGTARARIAAIESEGASVHVVDGTYEDAVALAAKEEATGCLLIQDNGWPGYEEIPRWVAEGYSTIFWEIDDALAARREPWPDLVVAQMGVGSFASALVRHCRRKDAKPAPRIIGVEPERAACVLASAKARRIVSVPGPHDSIMAGLNCGRPSAVAWPWLQAGMDCFVSVSDDRAREAMRDLAVAGIVAGETGAAGAAGLLELLTGIHSGAARRRLAIDRSTRVLLISTEGATDPESYQRIVGSRPQ